MRNGITFALAIAAAAFVLYTGQELPPRVASHFDFSGTANGFMSREGYLAFMTPITVGIPLAMALIAPWLGRRWPGSVNLPHRDYWLAPERREASIDSLAAAMALLAWALLLFLCFAHWRVVEANRLRPPQLAPSAFLPGLVAFLALAGFWTAWLYRRFRRPPALPETRAGTRNR